MKLLHIHEISEHLKGANIAQVQRDTGLSRPTLHALRDMSKPRFYHDTIVVLSEYFSERDNGE